MAAGAGAGAGAGAAACAACKYQRRRCTPDCPLAEFFPQDRSRVFRNAHRLFGVSNILKTLARAGTERRREAMHCIIYESQAWDINPATGCVPIIQDLQRRIRHAELDLRRTYAAIHAYRAADQGRSPFPDSDGGDSSASSSSSAPPPPFQFQLATGNNDHDVTAEAYGGRGGLPFMMYGGEQPQMMMNATASDGENIELQMLTWMMMQPPQYDMASAATAVADMASSGNLVQLPQQDHRFFVDATMMVPQPQHQQQPIIPIQPAAELDEQMSYLVDGMDGDNEMRHESTSKNCSDKKAIKAPKMEDNANGFK